MNGIRNSGKIDHISNHRFKYEKYASKDGVTDKFQFTDPRINDMLGGGIGRDGTFELCLIYGSSGAGKSILAENICINANRQGKKYALMSLENDPSMTWGRLLKMAKGDQEALMTGYMEFISRYDLKERFTIEDVGEEIDRLFNKQMCELVVIDHIQELLDLATKGTDGVSDNEKTRKFMQVVQDRLAMNDGTLVVLAHTNKSRLGGMESVYGSSSLYQKATKVVEINKDENGCIALKCHKSRNSVIKRYEPLPVVYDENLLVKVDDGITE